MTKEEIFAIVEEEDVEFIRLQFTDIFGTLKNIAITASQLEDAMENRILFDGSSVKGFAPIEDSDLYLHPDLSTFCIFPWRPQQGKVARFICDIYRADGSISGADPNLVSTLVGYPVVPIGQFFRNNTLIHLNVNYHTKAGIEILRMLMGGTRISRLMLILFSFIVSATALHLPSPNGFTDLGENAA